MWRLVNSVTLQTRIFSPKRFPVLPFGVCFLSIPSCLSFLKGRCPVIGSHVLSSPCRFSHSFHPFVLCVKVVLFCFLKFCFPIIDMIFHRDILSRCVCGPSHCPSFPQLPLHLGRGAAILFLLSLFTENTNQRPPSLHRVKSVFPHLPFLLESLFSPHVAPCFGVWICGSL